MPEELSSPMNRFYLPQLERDIQEEHIGFAGDGGFPERSQKKFIKQACGSELHSKQLHTPICIIFGHAE